MSHAVHRTSLFTTFGSFLDWYSTSTSVVCWGGATHMLVDIPQMVKPQIHHDLHDLQNLHDLSHSDLFGAPHASQIVTAS